MKNISRRYIGGFTLVEILVVVLIIGILSAVAVPMYQGAVDKTHFSTMLSPTRTLKEAQEAVRMATGNYTTDTADLDVDLSQEALSYQIKTTANGDEFNVILATNDKLPNVRLARYLDENLLLQGQLHCEAKIGDDRANKLCGPLLIGQEIKATGDGYMAYLLDEEIDQPTCDYAGKSFSTSKTKCYKDNATRCDALGMGTIGETSCGYQNANNKTIEAEGVCEVEVRGSNIRSSCDSSTIKKGGKCVAKDVGEGWDGYTRACAHSNVDGGAVICEVGNLCGWNSVFDNGSVCVSLGANNTLPCYAASFKNGSICYANSSGACSGYSSDKSVYYDETSCCCGKYCPSSAPKCDASRCNPDYLL